MFDLPNKKVKYFSPPRHFQHTPEFPRIGMIPDLTLEGTALI
jgi:hypothetical protein